MLELLRRVSPRFCGRVAACIGVLTLMSLCLIAFDTTSTRRRIQSAQNSLKHSTDAPQQMGRRFLLLAYMRSGSTFTSEVLTLNPDFNFMFEPLWLFRKASGFSWRRGSDTESAAHLISQMLRCDPVLTGFAMNSTFVNRTRFDMNSCVENPLLMKTIRVHGAIVEDLLRMNPELKVIHLMRDPRGILASRADRKQPTSAQAVCNQMEADITVMDQLSADEHTNRYISVKYEDLVNPTLSQSIIKDLYGFMDVALDVELLQGYLRSHYGDGSKLAKTGYNTFRDEHFDPNTWRTKMTPAAQKQVEDQCALVMKRFGYTSSQRTMNKCVDSTCR